MIAAAKRMTLARAHKLRMPVHGALLEQAVLSEKIANAEILLGHWTRLLGPPLSKPKGIVSEDSALMSEPP